MKKDKQFHSNVKIKYFAYETFNISSGESSLYNQTTFLSIKNYV